MVFWVVLICTVKFSTHVDGGLRMEMHYFFLQFNKYCHMINPVFEIVGLSAAFLTTSAFSSLVLNLKALMRSTT